MSFRTLKQQNAAIAAARLENAKKSCIAEVYQQHQEFIRCEANNRAIIGVIEGFIGTDVIPTASLFEDALAVNPEEIQNFARQPLATAKEQVIDEYITLLNARSRQDRYSLDMERKRMNHMTLPQAREKLASLKLRQMMAAQPVPELKKVVSDAQPSHGYPALPREIWRDGQFVMLDAASIKRMHPSEISRLIRVYGANAVNKRLSQVQQ